ncbi:GNAT family N-acetyltransferase [Pseudonocardia sp. ICBG601]|uniref:GNAT family N-acetyltransferase n=1 Tax=Pseudonocardia sp. ICBG601 TaxID=2846759 RepID=UPI001CF694B4|nr:GNAT family protein [Pseudonocardia sp. ICBG601]
MERKMRLVEVRPTPAGHLAVMERFDDWNEPDGFPRIAGEQVVAGELYLRNLAPEDASMIVECDNDELSRRWALFPGSTQQRAENAARRGYLDWRLTDRAALTIAQSVDDAPVGLIKVRKLVPPGVADVGYQVRPGYRGRSYAARALEAFCRWSAAVGLFHRFELGIKPGNTASIRVAEKAGFTFEGRRAARLVDLDGGRADELHYARVILTGARQAADSNPAHITAGGHTVSTTRTH